MKGDVAKLIQLQNEDQILEKIRASASTTDHNEYYRHDNGIIMRKCQPGTKLRKQVGDQIVAPNRYRQHLIEIAHDKTEHLGI